MNDYIKPRRDQIFLEDLEEEAADALYDKASELLKHHANLVKNSASSVAKANKVFEYLKVIGSSDAIKYYIQGYSPDEIEFLTDLRVMVEELRNDSDKPLLLACKEVKKLCYIITGMKVE